MGDTTVAVDVDAVLADLREIHARFGGPEGARRLAWTQDWRDARAWLRDKLAELPVSVDEDEAGNLWAQLDGDAGDFVIVGSHSDAVPGGGWLDGVLGVTAALGVLRALVAAGSQPPVSVRFVDWADEEGARFGRSVVGSSAAAGTLDADAVRDLRDAAGMRLQDAMAACGVELDAAPAAAGRLDGALAYLELHIEQGPVLLEAGRAAAAVAGTVGDERYLVEFSGQSAHAGSTPMLLRRDTLAAAAGAALEIREIAIRHGGVATVGSIRSRPGVMTAVAGASEMMLDLRHLDPEALAAMLRECLGACEAAAAAFGCTAHARHVFSAAPTPFHPRLVELARHAVIQAGGGDGPPVPSGPLHDATEIGRRVPAAMVFCQSDPPLSHTAIEDSPEAALRIAIDAYGRLVGAAVALLAATPLDSLR